MDRKHTEKRPPRSIMLMISTPKDRPAGIMMFTRAVMTSSSSAAAEDRAAAVVVVFGAAMVVARAMVSAYIRGAVEPTHCAFIHCICDVMGLKKR